LPFFETGRFYTRSGGNSSPLQHSLRRAALFPGRVVLGAPRNVHPARQVDRDLRARFLIPRRLCRHFFRCCPFGRRVRMNSRWNSALSMRALSC